MLVTTLTLTVSLVSATHWVSFITHLNDLCRCPSKSDFELNSSKQRLHELLTLLAIVSFLSYAFPSKFVILKSIYCESCPLRISGPLTKICPCLFTLQPLLSGNHRGIFSFIRHHNFCKFKLVTKSKSLRQ